MKSLTIGLLGFAAGFLLNSGASASVLVTPQQLDVPEQKMAMPFSSRIAETGGWQEARGRSGGGRRSSGGGYSGYGASTADCPCSGGDVCIGPRGGRYCITSGGNKRYGR